MEGGVEGGRSPLINVCTVHFKSDAWIDVQARYLADNVVEPYRVWASLEGVDECHDALFHAAYHDAARTHAQKLDFLAAEVARSAAPEDLLVFLDGDAFPIAPIAGPLRQLLAERPLVAVRRDENNGDRQPHPCFCATTVGYWTEIGGTWERGHRWTNAIGDSVTDVGGELLGILEARGEQWSPLLRMSTHALDPVWFGIYGHEGHGRLVYHHGAGFRVPTHRVDKAAIGSWTDAPAEPGTPMWNPRTIAYRLRKRRWYRERAATRDRHRNTVDRAERLSRRVIEDIQRDPQFHERY